MTGLPATDLDDPERLIAIAWGAAIRNWDARKPASVLRLIAQLPLPKDLVSYLTAAVGRRKAKRSNTAPVHAMIMEAGLPIPAFAVEFLTDVVGGKAARPDGRPCRLAPMQERELAIEVFRAQDAESAKGRRRNARVFDAAIAAVAKCHRGMSTGRIRGIVNKVTAQGLTPDVWRRWIRGSEEAIALIEAMRQRLRSGTLTNNEWWQWYVPGRKLVLRRHLMEKYRQRRRTRLLRRNSKR
jgi:hypothetical protein